ncbi:competence protein F [Geobacter sp. OR-1]|uniref:ComF family protein n=1 Tax=Geobacter sp. OR-1 TaxID=1266765 RepID=UPI000542013E|nr:ComF family protein [Geobacter sp. OR-1]GAM09219.1 competence protein F [Geobacter sp. OR-1]
MLKSLIDLVFPPLCHNCRQFIPDAGRIHVCPECIASSKPLQSPICPCCGIPFATDEGIDHLCGSCIEKHPPFDAARGAFVYEGAVRDLIHRLKYDRKIQCRRPLALLLLELLSGAVEEFSPEMLVPVPLHKRRLRERGFNQAILIAELLAREWKIPLERRLLQRVRWTEPQINLAAGERAANVKGAFALSDPKIASGRRIVLIDDVLTTGSTVAECSRVLKKAGAAAVLVVTVARVP